MPGVSSLRWSATYPRTPRYRRTAPVVEQPQRSNVPVPTFHGGLHRRSASMPGHRYQHNDRAGHDDQAGDDTGDPWLRRGCGLGSGWADSGYQPSIDPWLAGLPPLRVRSGRMSTPAAGTGWAHRTPGQGPGRLCGGRWRGLGKRPPKPHTANGRQCVHCRGGRWTARDHAGTR